MKLKNFKEGSHNVSWVCPNCLDIKSITHSSPFSLMDLSVFDNALNLWVDGCTSGQAGRLCSMWSPVYLYYRILRRACSFYIRLKVLPFLKLPGPVEVDETKIGPKNNNEFSRCPDKINWILGLFCRHSRLVVGYYVPNRAHTTLVKNLRKHIESGAVLISDTLSSYVK